MPAFVYNRFSGESYQSQWQKHLQQSAYYADLTSALNAQKDEYRKCFNELLSATRSGFEMQAETMKQTAFMLADSLEVLDQTIFDGFTTLNSSLNDLAVTLDWRLGKLEDQLHIINFLLQNVTELLRIPDFQKERQYFIETGFKHYKNAVLDPDLSQDALTNLLEAETREKTDYIVLHRIGMIYLYDPKQLDIAKAEDYFRRAAKYAIVDASPNAAKMASILANTAEQVTAANAPKELAAQSNFQASVACYAQGKFAEAAELAQKAFALSPNLFEAAFIQAKALAANNLGTQAAPVVANLIQQRHLILFENGKRCRPCHNPRSH